MTIVTASALDDTLDMLDIDFPSAWRADDRSGVELFADSHTGAGIRISTTPAADRALGVVVAQERTKLMKLQGFVLARSMNRHVGGFPAEVMTFHFVAAGHREFGILAVTIRNGLATELRWTRHAGHEADDQALFNAILGTVVFYG